MYRRPSVEILGTGWDARVDVEQCNNIKLFLVLKDLYMNEQLDNIW